jgi:hypothetical protein
MPDNAHQDRSLCSLGRRYRVVKRAISDISLLSETDLDSQQLAELALPVLKGQNRPVAVFRTN